MANESPSRGVTLHVDSSGGSSYSAVGRLVAIQPPSMTRGTGETTVMDSSDVYRTFLKGWKDGGEVSFTIRHHQTEYGTLRDIFEDDTAAVPNWKITFPLLTGQSSGATSIFLGIVTALGKPEISIENDDPITVDITIKVSGKPVFTAGS